MSDEILSEDLAREQLQQLLDYYDVDLESMDDDGRLKSMVEKKLIKAIRSGKVEIEQTPDEFIVRQTVGSETIVYHELDGRAKVQMDRFKGRHERLYGLLGMMAKKPIEKIQCMRVQDLQVAEFLGMIFLMG